MKKIICFVVVLVMCLSLAAPAFATENGFVPSITYKPEPEIVPVEDEEVSKQVGRSFKKAGINVVVKRFLG